MTKSRIIQKVLHVIGELDFGGAELMVSQIARLQVRRGWAVTLLILSDANERFVAGQDYEGIEIIYLKSRAYSFRGILQLRELIAKSQWDIVHAHLFPALYWCALSVVGVERHFKLIYTEHSTGNRRRHYKALRYVERIIYGCYDEVVAVSLASQQALQLWAVGLEVILIENGVDVDRFTMGAAPSRDRYGLSDDDLLVLCVGRFRKEKNQSILIASMEYLPEKYKLVLVGDGPIKPYLEECCRRRGVESRVKFLGALHDVVPIMRMSDVYVLPSLFEGFGLSALEAFLAGLPVVYSNVPGLRDLLSGVGIPVDSLSSKSVSDGIKCAVQSPLDNNYHAKMDFIREKYSIQRVEAQYWDVYCG